MAMARARRAAWQRLDRFLHGPAGGAAAAYLDLLFPPRCAGCGRQGSHFCAACAAAVRPLRPPWCSSCGRSIAGGDRCADCRLDPLPLAALRSAGAHTGHLRRAVHVLKYRGGASAGRALADLLVRPASDLSLPSPVPPSPVRTPSVPPSPVGRQLLVIPVPLHPLRERERGYNQAALLARPLAAALCLSYAPAALRRIRSTDSQVGLDRRKRRLNLRGAFAAGPPVGGHPILLVDDVVTTGSTLGSAAEACLAAGAAGVWALTLAREV